MGIVAVEIGRSVLLRQDKPLKFLPLKRIFGIVAVEKPLKASREPKSGFADVGPVMV